MRHAAFSTPHLQAARQTVTDRFVTPAAMAGATRSVR